MEGVCCHLIHYCQFLCLLKPLFHLRGSPSCQWPRGDKMSVAHSQVRETPVTRNCQLLGWQDWIWLKAGFRKQHPAHWPAKLQRSNVHAKRCHSQGYAGPRPATSSGWVMLWRVCVACVWVCILVSQQAVSWRRNGPVSVPITILPSESPFPSPESQGNTHPGTPLLPLSGGW